MDYASWMEAKLALGATPEAIAYSALYQPLAVSGGLKSMLPILEISAKALNIRIENFKIVGSARYGFSLRDGTQFNPRFSDLDVAIIDQELFNRCEVAVGQISKGPRFPELELPANECAAFRRATDGISRKVLERFAYVSFAVYPDLETLVISESAKIKTYLGLRGECTQNESPKLSEKMGISIFQKASKSELPLFMGLVNESPPAISSPYVTDIYEFRNAFDRSATRNQLLNELDNVFSDLKQIIDVDCCLVGGSFINLDKENPNDIDIVIFYRINEQSVVEPGLALLRLSRKFLLRGIDAHFIPCDAERWLPVKMASFYTSLFHSNRTKSENRRGLVLITPNLET